MKRPTRGSNGLYHIQGKAYKMCIGSRQQVWHGTAFKTPGGLKKHDLFMNKWHRIVSLKKHKTAKRERRLEKHGFFAKKGSFGYVKKAVRRTRKHKKH